MQIIRNEELRPTSSTGQKRPGRSMRMGNGVESHLTRRMARVMMAR